MQTTLKKWKTAKSPLGAEASASADDAKEEYIADKN